MLEIRELYKIYKPKKGVSVTALNKVSLKFPEKGMVFLLGKSGSGKSTLLNLLGGLDKYDSGEIIIKGVSSKDFNQQHFDSYRNTYVGFIFQEYNVLDEFSVGANIALALELQGEKADDNKINEILREVDLEGYGNRKPNELSGGQKQRVAIARALVKNPEIIMADEPTGALDSNTGKQVFDTLKKLSKDKLVIIVSHDREFSEIYADRIIELSDGNVISDVELAKTDKDTENTGLQFCGDTIEVANGYHLTEEDRMEINHYIDQMNDKNFRLKLDENGRMKKFVPTNQNDIKIQGGSKFKLIKSKLPLKSAFKIGSSSLKYKKFRLFMTILLSCVSFGLFALADTFGAYDHIRTCTKSLIDSNVEYVSVMKGVKVGKGVNEYYDSWDTKMSNDDLAEFKKNTGIEMFGIFKPYNVDLYFGEYCDPETEFTETEFDIYAKGFIGYAEVNQKVLDSFGYEILSGTLPDGSKNEIAISKYVYETFKLGKYSATGEKPYQPIQYFDDIVGKTLKLNGTEYKITGVVDTKIDLERYKSLTEKKEGASASDQLIDYALVNEFSSITEGSLSSVIMVGEGHLAEMIKAEPKLNPINKYFVFFNNEYFDIDPTYACKLSEIDKSYITWINGEKTTLGEKEIIVDESCIYQFDSAANVDMYQSEYTFCYYGNHLDEYGEINGYKIVGVIKTTDENGEPTKASKMRGTVILNDKDYEKFIDERYVTGPYSIAIGSMPKEEENVEKMVNYCYQEDSNVQYQLQNAVTYELDAIHSVLKVLSKIFLYIGIGFAVFAALMLANFIATSISYKKQEIGILRAIGSRGNDVFRIFFAESFIIAMVNFVLSAVIVGVLTSIINGVIRTELGVLITVLHFGIRQVGLLFILSIMIAFVASFLPVKKIASKRPIDAIRNR